MLNAPLLRTACWLALLPIAATADRPVRISTGSLPNASVGIPYSASLSAKDGNPPYSWSISNGGLPAGLQLDSSKGSISGTPTAAGTYPFTAKVTDGEGDSDTQGLSIEVEPAPLAVITAILPDGTVGVAYSQALSAIGGAVPEAPAPAVEVRFRIPEETALDDALARVRATVDAQPRVSKDPAPSVLLDRSGAENALEIVASFSTEGDIGPVKSDLIKAVHDALQDQPPRRAAA